MDGFGKLNLDLNENVENNGNYVKNKEKCVKR